MIEFKPGSYRMRNGREVEIIDRRHGWELIGTAQLCEGIAPHTYSWVVRGVVNGWYRGSRASLREVDGVDLSEFDLVARVE